MLRFLILSGYFELVMYLQVSGKLNQYINIHYSYLAYISMVLSFILAVVQLIVWMKQIKVTIFHWRQGAILIRPTKRERLSST